MRAATARPPANTTKCAPVQAAVREVVLRSSARQHMMSRGSGLGSGSSCLGSIDDEIEAAPGAQRRRCEVTSRLKR